MKLSNWKETAEILSGIAVVATLIILILEVQENTSATRAASYSNSVQRLNEWRYEMAREPELLGVFTSEERAELTDKQRRRLELLRSAPWAIYEDAFFSHGYDILGAEEFERYKVQICLLFERGRSSGTWDSSVSRMTDGFKAYIAKTCNGTGA
jgi:hypothetical protein